MTKSHVKSDVLKKIITRWTRHAPPEGPKMEPLARLVHAFLEYDAEMGRAQSAEQRLVSTMADYNELRVTPAIELAAILGVRYAFAESRCSSLHRTLQAIFEREKQMSLESLHQMHKPEIRKYLKSLAGINPYVEAAVALDCFGVPAAPVDMKLLLWLKNKQAVTEECTVLELQLVLERQIRAPQMGMFFRASRKDLEDWMPKVWPAVTRTPSTVVAPPQETPEVSPVKTQPPATGTEPASAPAHASKVHRKKWGDASSEKAGGAHTKVKPKPSNKD
jgi:endonuclease III